MIPIVSQKFFGAIPSVMNPIFGDGIILTSIVAVLLNAFFNPVTATEAPKDTLPDAQAVEHI
jgi:NCS2 family nucleobase:cation symporter-2